MKLPAQCRTAARLLLGCATSALTANTVTARVRACACREAAARSAARSQPEHAIYIVSPDGTQVSTPVLRALFRPIPHPYHSVPTYLAAYAAFCLLPGLLFSLAVLFFSYKVMGASLAVTMAISVVESSVTILVWVISPTK